MSGVVHLHRKVAGSLNLGFLPTYLPSFFFFLGGVSINSEWRKCFYILSLSRQGEEGEAPKRRCRYSALNFEI